MILQGNEEQLTLRLQGIQFVIRSTVVIDQIVFLILLVESEKNDSLTFDQKIDKWLAP